MKQIGVGKDIKTQSNKNQPISTKLGLSCNFCVFWSYFSSRIIQFFCSHSNAHMIGDFFSTVAGDCFFIFCFCFFEAHFEAAQGRK